MPDISIIIPAYNAENYLEATIQSVLKQEGVDWELLIVNDGSTDGTASMCDLYAEIDNRIRVVHQKNCGLSQSRNRGIQEISKDSTAVAFLDADDLYYPDTISTLWHSLKDIPQATVTYGAARFIDAAGDLYMPLRAESLSRNRLGVRGRRLEKWPIERPTELAVLFYQNPIWTPGQCLVRRAALDKVGGFDATISAVADWDMWTRLAHLGDLVYIDQVLLDYRRHDSNMSSGDELMRRDELTLRRKWINMPLLSKTDKQLIFYGYRLSERYFARQRIRFARECFTSRRFVTALKHLVHAIIRYCRSLINIILG